MKRRLISSGILTISLVALPVITLPATANNEVNVDAVPNATIVEHGIDRDQAVLEAALDAQANGFPTQPKDFSLVTIDDVSVVLPKGSTLNSVTENSGHISVDWTPDLTQDNPAALSEASALDVISDTGMLLRNGSCNYVKENGTGWMRTCYERYRSKSTITWNGKKQYLNAIAVQGQFKSKGIWTMYKARIRANPRVSDISRVKSSPKSDQNKGNCRNITLSAEVKGVGISSSHDICDKWDIGSSKTGQMDNTWFGKAWRTERNVAMIVAVSRVSKKDVTWSIQSDFWAN